MTKSVADEIKELQSKLSAIQEAKPGAGGIVGDLFKSFTKAARAAKELGPEVRLSHGLDDGIETWRQIPGTYNYKLSAVDGKPIPDPPIKNAVEMLEMKNDYLRRPDMWTNPEEKWAMIEKELALHEKQVETMLKTGKFHIDPEMQAWKEKNKASFEETIKKFYPEADVKFKNDKELKLKFLKTVEEEGKKRGVVNIKKILIALGIIAALLYTTDKVIPKKDKVDTGGGGTKVNTADGSNATTIPADEISWSALGYKGLEGQSVSKNSKGEWVTPSGAKATDPEMIKKLEELAAMSSEKRKDLKSRQDAPFQVFLYNPDDAGGSSDANAEINLQQNKVPSSKW